MPSAEMPRYRCHKTVHALKISGARVLVTGEVELSIAEDGFAPVVVQNAVVSRYMPQVGDYLVHYEDGYHSISPKKAFEEGYTRISPTTQDGKPWAA